MHVSVRGCPLVVTGVAHSQCEEQICSLEDKDGHLGLGRWGSQDGKAAVTRPMGTKTAAEKSSW